MKTQAKPFMVEHKLSRRAGRQSDQSIWAGVDLAAVAEEVIDDLPAQDVHQDKINIRS